MLSHKLPFHHRFNARPSRLNDAGFSLPELMIGLGVLMICLLVGLRVSTMIADITKNSRLKDNQIGLTNIVTERIRYPDLCGASLGLSPSIPLGALNPVTTNPAPGGNINSTLEVSVSIPGIQAGPAMDSDIIEKDQVILPLGLKVTSLKLTNPVDVSGPPPFDPAVSNRSIMAVLQMSVSKIDENSPGIGAFANRVAGTMVLEVTPANEIVGCHTDQVVSLKEVCEDFGCTYDVNAVLPALPCTCPFKPLTGCLPWHIPAGVKGGQMDCKPWGGLCPDGFVMTGGSAAPAQATCIADPVWVPPLPMPSTEVEFASSTSAVLEGNTVFIRVLLPGAQPGDITVNYTVGGTATNVTDYAVPASIVIPAGNTSLNIQVDTVMDSPLVDDGETVVLTLTGASGGLTIGGTSVHTVTITDAVEVITGTCGPANGNSYPDAASVNTAGLCTTGTPSPLAVADPGPWSWVCAGSGGGTNANCAAVAPVGAPCGPVDGVTVADGASRVFYYQMGVHQCDGGCGMEAETRTCNAGVLSGTAMYASCNTIPLCALCNCP